MKFDFLINHTRLIPKIAELRFAEFSYLVPGKTLDEFVNGLQEHCNDCKLPITYVALKGNDFLGTFSLRQCDLHSHSHLTPWIGGVLVPSEKRNQGIGSLLVKEGEAQAREMGFDSLYLFTPNKAPWYTKLGWSTVETASLNHTPITIMQKTLSDFKA